MVSAATCPLPQSSLTQEDYLTFERESQTKHHFLNGHLVPFAPVSFVHNLIAGNLLFALHTALRKTNYGPLGSGMRIQVAPNAIFYADALVVGPPELNPLRDVLLNPVLVAEVLSPADTTFERGQKWAQYRKLPSLQHILFFQEDRPDVEHYRRIGDNNWALHATYTDLSRKIHLTIDEHPVYLPMEEIYRRVSFPDAEEAKADK